MSKQPRSFGPVTWCLMAALLFGATTPAAKSLVDDMGPILLSGLLYWGAALAVSPAAIRDWRKDRKTPRQGRGLLLGAVVFGGLVGPILMLWGLSLANAGSVSLWLTLETVATAVLARLFFREHLGALGWLATGLVVAASIGLAGPESGGLAAAILVGLACIAWGLDNNLTSLIDGYSTAEITGFKGLYAGAVSVPIGLLVGGAATGTQLMAALLIGAVGYGASLMLYVAGAQQLGATRSQLYFSTAPLFGLAVAWGVFDEYLGVSHFVAIGIMATALWILYLESHEHEHDHEAQEHTHWHRHDDGHHDHDHQYDQSSTGRASGAWHQHRHAHRAKTHRHAHSPDLHHRHAHDSHVRKTAEDH
ncbi:MAG: DMT family transporter [Myxococcales bacterium]|nr:DMT family transporter [Myxococcales bacterium]HIK85921.1 DMT family transporter [Myxococcales bacterium]